MLNSTRVSVFMPVYNAGEHLIAAIQSILDQTFRDFEFVIVNDGSTDNSRDIILSFKDPRIRLLDNPANVGLIASLNIGLKECRGEYIVRMDQDDISLPQRIEKQIGFLDATPSIGLTGSWFENFGDDMPSFTVKYDTTDAEIRIRHLYQTHISHPTAVIRTNVVKENNLQFDPLFLHGEDYEFWVKMSEFCQLANFPECLVRKRDHVNNISNKYAADQRNSCNMVKQKQFRKMGVEITSAEADLYTRFADPEWGFTAPEMAELEQLLLRIYAANEKSEFIPAETYRNYLAEKWFHLCYQNGNIGRGGWQRFSQAPFSKGYDPGIAGKLKFRLKSAFQK